MFNHYFQHVYALKADLEKLGCTVEVSEFTKDGDDWLTVQITYPPGVVPPPLPSDGDYDHLPTADNDGIPW